MKRAKLFHPVVFDDQKWAAVYYKRNVKAITKVGQTYVQLLQASGFTGGNILDVGCGFGAVAIAIARAFPKTEIMGVDLAAPLLEMARRDAERAGVGNQVTFQTGDATKLDFENDTFDVVINTFLLHIVQEPVTMLNELERVTKPDAKLMITDLRRTWLGLLIKTISTSFTQDEALDIIRASKLRPGIPFKGSYWWSYMAGIKTTD